MKEGRCPICKSTSVFAADPERTSVAVMGDSLYVDFGDGMDGEKQLELNPYVCTVCGYTALFVDELDKLPQLMKSKGWHRVQPTK